MVLAKIKVLGMAAAAALLGIFAVGCGDSVPKGRPFGPWEPTMQNPPVRAIKPSGTEKSIDMLKPNDVVAAVNGVALTRREIDMRLAQFKWTLARTPNLNDKDRKLSYKVFGRNLVSNWVNTQLVVWESRKMGCAEEAQIRDAVRKGVEHFSDRMRISIDTLEKHLPGGLELMRYDLEDQVWIMSYVTNNVKPSVEVDSNMVARIIASIDEENARISASNAVQRAKIDSALVRVREPGADFGKIADEVSEDDMLIRDGTGYWGDYKAGDISDPDLRRKFFSYGVGDISEVIEDGEGYMILKVLDKDPASANGESDGDSISLARIFVASEQLNVLADPVGLKADLVRQYQKKAMDARLGELSSAAEIVYPYGTDFWGTKAKFEALKKRNAMRKSEREKFLEERAKRAKATNDVEKASK